MDPRIVAAVVAGGFGLITSVITIAIKEYLDNRSKLPISPGRRDAISGTWEGRAYQEQGIEGKPFDYPITLVLKAGRKSLSGTLTIRYEKNRKVDQDQFNIAGGFFHGSFLQLNYTPVDEKTIQFGSVVLKLDANGKNLDGRFSGYGRVTEAVVSERQSFKRYISS